MDTVTEPGDITRAFEPRDDYPYDPVHPAVYAAMTGQPIQLPPGPAPRIPADAAELDALLTGVAPEQAETVNRLISRMMRKPDDDQPDPAP